MEQELRSVLWFEVGGRDGKSLSIMLLIGLEDYYRFVLLNLGPCHVRWKIKTEFAGERFSRSNELHDYRLSKSSPRNVL